MEKILPIYELSINDDDEVGVNFISIVDRPAIEKSWQVFEQTKELKFEIKDKEKRIVSGPAMIANLPIYRRDKARGEYYVIFKPESIRKIAERYFRNRFTNNVNMNHANVTDGVFVFESFIIDKERGIKTPEGFDELPDGSWFISMKIDNEDVWENFVKTGTLTGFSVEGVFIEEHLVDAEEKKIKNIIEILNSFRKNIFLSMELQTKIKKTIKEAIGEKAFSTIEKLLKASFMEVTAKDGTVLKYEGDLAEGVAIFISTPDGDIAAPDGVVELEDGTMVEISAGVVKSLTKSAPPEDKKPEDMTEVVAGMTAQLEALAKRLDDIEKKFKSTDDINSKVDNAIAELSSQKESFTELKSSVVDIAHLVNTISEMPISQPKEKEKFSTKKDAQEERVKNLIETLNKLKK